MCSLRAVSSGRPRSEVLLDPDVQLPVRATYTRHPEPAPTPDRQQGWLGQFGPAQHADVELALPVFRALGA